MEVGILNGRVLYTGGAEGVDALTEELARRYNMSVCVIIPPTHSRAVRITPLTESMLHEGLQHVLRANKTLQRSLHNNVLKTGLLQRNYWVVRDTNLVLAFGHFDTTKPHTLQGGTGWSVQMALEQQKPVCVYTDRWYQFDYPQQRFVPCHPPYLHPQNTTIVGSRRITLQMTKSYTIYFREPFRWKLDRFRIFGFINIVKKRNNKKNECCNKSLTLLLLSSPRPYSKCYIFLLPLRPYTLRNCTLYRKKI